jgi:hypothetical protein
VSSKSIQGFFDSRIQVRKNNGSAFPRRKLLLKNKSAVETKNKIGCTYKSERENKRYDPINILKFNRSSSAQTKNDKVNKHF